MLNILATEALVNYWVMIYCSSMTFGDADGEAARVSWSRVAAAKVLACCWPGARELVGRLAG